MRTMTASQIADLHAARTAKGAGYAPSLAECLTAAREGRLYDVDTANAGGDALAIADDAATAVEGWADATFGLDAGDDYIAACARWTAERVTLDAAEHSVGCASGGDCTVRPGDTRCSRLHSEVAEVLDRAASAAYEGRSVEEYVGASGASEEEVARAAAEGRALRVRDDRDADVRRWREGRRALRGHVG